MIVAAGVVITYVVYIDIGRIRVGKVFLYAVGFRGSTMERCGLWGMACREEGGVVIC
jgi:hypothetical protein